MNERSRIVGGILNHLSGIKRKPQRKTISKTIKRAKPTSLTEEIEKLKLKPKDKVFTLVDGKTRITTKDLKEGNAVFVINVDNEINAPLPSGVYELEESKTIEVEEGQIVRIYKTIKASKLVRFKGVIN